MKVLLATLALLATSAFGGRDDDRDSITIAGKRKPVLGRVIQANDPDVLHFRKAGDRHPEEFNATKVSYNEPLLRLRIQQWLDGRSNSDTVSEMWLHWQAAIDLKLFALARLQAYEVLTVEPTHEAAHKFLGHKQKGAKWHWSLDTTGEALAKGKSAKHLSSDKFHKHLSKRADNLAFVSENYYLETNTSLQRAVRLLFDLERAYCSWMSEFGASTIASETTWDPSHRMTVRVYRGPEDGFTENHSKERYPYYSASLERSVAGSHNVFFSYWTEDSGAHPVQFFDLATQQLVYSTLALGHAKAAPPKTERDLWAHWIELGLGYWMERGFDGELGYTKFVPLKTPQQFKLPDNMARDALKRARRSPLNQSKEETTNLIGLQWSYFYTTDDTGKIHRAKARSLVSYLLSQNPFAKTARGKLSNTSARDGLACYLIRTYKGTSSHSSSELDLCLNGRVESLEAGWKTWLAKM